MADEYDNTNSGVIFPPHPEQKFSGQGKLNIEGTTFRVVMLYEPVSNKDDTRQLVLYAKIGVLFENQERENEKSPHFSGPLDAHPNLRIAGWKGDKDGLRYISLRASPRKNRETVSHNADDGWNDSILPGGHDDEIPF